MHMRQMRSTDLEDVLPLVQETKCSPQFDVDWLRYQTVGDLTCPSDLCLLAESETGIVGFCFGCLRGGRGVIKLFGVAAPRRRAGIASALFEEMESRFRQRGASRATVGGVAPNYFSPGVPVSGTAAISFLLQRGYETDRKTRVDMLVDLQEADLDTVEVIAWLAKKGIVLRRAAEDEIEAVAAFAQRHFSHEWSVEVKGSSRFCPPPLFVALKDRNPIGFAAYDVTGVSRFGPTGTHRRYRNQGIGSALLKKCLQSMRARGDSTAEIGWVRPIDYYARAVGARVHRAYWMFHKKLNQVS